MSEEEIKKPLHHKWPLAEAAEACIKCGVPPKLFIIDAGFNWIGCPCTQTEPIGGCADESYNNWKEINR